MTTLTLAAGLFLPWLCGYLWLANAEDFFVKPGEHNRWRQAGYGFFLGYAILHAVIMGSAALAGSVTYPVVLGIVAVLTGVAGLLMYLRRGAPGGAGTGHWRAHQGRVAILLMALLALWIAAHLMFAAVEILTRPVYPWDAWLLWVYRAKAWFYLGNVADMAGPRAWAAGVEPLQYTVHAAGYPKFASVIPFWTALSLGEWSDTLVNLPVWLCGAAIGMALYGQCRAAGLGTLAALAVCYLLYSTPIFGAHMALGGYADLWMAGFTGLGFAALLRGLGGGERGQVVLGMVMLALALLVKNEGAAWFMAGWLLLALTTLRPRVLLWVLGAVALVSAAAAFFGFGYIEIPAAGGLGVSGGLVHLPLVGSFRLEVQNVWRAYLENFFVLGNWHLTWALVAVGMGLACLRPGGRGKRVALWFLLLFCATQVFIFGFTDQGNWASRYTAINRLPLQFLPALWLALAMLVPWPASLRAGAKGAGHD